MKAETEKPGVGTRRRCLIIWACVLAAAASLLSAYAGAVALQRVLALEAEISSMREELERYKGWLEQLGPLAGGGRAANGSAAASQAGQRAWSRERLAEGGGKSRRRRRRRRRSPLVHTRSSLVQLIAASSRKLAARASNCQRCVPGRPQQTCRAEHKPVLSQNQAEETPIPWILSLRKGTALGKADDRISVRETGYFLVYSQVWYKDNTFTMGHFVKRIKANVVGNEPRSITLFRCIQNMPACCPNNSCFTAGIAKLEAGDELQLVIPRSEAHVALTGDGTFFGAVKLS